MMSTEKTSYQFTKTDAYQALKELAKKPFDLTADKGLTPERLRKYAAHALGFTLIYGTERVNDEVMQALDLLAKAADVHKKMKAMQNGEVMNSIDGCKSEERQVLHTALRDFFKSPNLNRPAAEAARKAKEQVMRIESFMARIDEENRFDHLLVVGIGGSNLGPEANYIALEHLKKKNRSLHFISNVDSDDAADKLSKVNLKRTLTLLVSKSGTTLETLTNEALVRKAYEKASLDPSAHMITATGEGSPYDNKEKYLDVFLFWDWVGGRFSTTSVIGGIIFTFAFGFEVFWEYLRGAHEMDLLAMSHKSYENLPLLLALLGIWNRNFLSHPMLAEIPYSYALRRFAAHIQQVDMESNGKHIDKRGQEIDCKTGPVPFGEPGTNAQHSFFQLIHQGTTIVPLEFIGFKECQRGSDNLFEETTSQEKLLSNLFAQAIALAQGKRCDNPNQEFLGNRPSHMLLGKKLTPFSMGALHALYEHKIAFQGFIWNINSFDQEGVQLGKVLAGEIIRRFAHKSGSSKETAESYPLGDAFLELLDKL